MILAYSLLMDCLIEQVLQSELSSFYFPFLRASIYTFAAVLALISYFHTVILPVTPH